MLGYNNSFNWCRQVLTNQWKYERVLYFILITDVFNTAKQLDNFYQFSEYQTDKINLRRFEKS